MLTILAEGAMALPVTLSGGVLCASWKLLQFLSSLTVKVILAIFMWASAQYHSKNVLFDMLGFYTFVMPTLSWRCSHVCLPLNWSGRGSAQQNRKAERPQAFQISMDNSIRKANPHWEAHYECCFRCVNLYFFRFCWVVALLSNIAT